MWLPALVLLASPVATLASGFRSLISRTAPLRFARSSAYPTLAGKPVRDPAHVAVNPVPAPALSIYL